MGFELFENAKEFPGLGFDPSPGQPPAMVELATRTRESVSEATHLVEGMEAAGQTSMSWTGVAADAFRTDLDATATRLREMLPRLRATVEALDTWAASLGTFDQQGQDLESRARGAAAQVDRLEQSPHLQRHNLSPIVAPEERANRKQAEEALGQAVQMLEAIRAEGMELRKRHDETAQRIAADIKRSTMPYGGGEDSGSGSPGWIDRKSEFNLKAGDFWAGISATTGAAPPLTLISSATSADALIFHALADLGGESVPWRTYMWDTLGIVPGVNLLRNADKTIEWVKGLGYVVTGAGLGDLFNRDFEPITAPFKWADDNIVDKIPGSGKIKKIFGL
ncbi:WXG100 family type VII secretion target [Embleya sp. NBC_00896]|uniref:WXG100 family type VII secretion target n=1 Tax=Embleya sp. NBC_00896 TaxID=2975961 RepID=UPI00386CDBB8|nr:hypothetical protein OG928_23625 [Embleya sp. NBC_00896]